jgi:hypothetical protein
MTNSYNRFRVALAMQDACNLRAIARAFVQIVDAAAADCGSTDATYADAAVVLAVGKIESLCHSDDRFSAAYDVACERADVEDHYHA